METSFPSVRFFLRRCLKETRKVSTLLLFATSGPFYFLSNTPSLVTHVTLLFNLFPSLFMFTANLQVALLPLSTTFSSWITVALFNSTSVLMLGSFNIHTVEASMVCFGLLGLPSLSDRPPPLFLSHPASWLFPRPYDDQLSRSLPYLHSLHLTLWPPSPVFPVESF